jgi:organic radical activating enzyme
MEALKTRSKTTTSTLNVSEHFYSIQGEGSSTGYPAYFIRLRGCNLMCGGPGGSLMKEGKATWWCDTEYVWRRGRKTSYDDIIQQWREDSILEWVLEGRVHLIWTGGEPTLPKHQKDIVKFLDYLDSSCYNEIETNGTQYIEDDLFEELDQINCSVKLANSGMSIKKRINESALKRIMEHDSYWFKFVISNEADLMEIEQDFVIPFDIDPKRVLMMPGLDSRDNYHERTRFCLEMAKKYGYVGLTRLHVSAWDRTTGV